MEKSPSEIWSRVSCGVTVKAKTETFWNKKRTRECLEKSKGRNNKGYCAILPRDLVYCSEFITISTHARFHCTKIPYTKHWRKVLGVGDIGSQQKCAFQHGWLGCFVPIQSHHNTFCWKQSTWKHKKHPFKIELKITF